MFKSILVPVDLLEPQMAERTLAGITSYLQNPDTTLCLLNVRYMVPQMMGEYLPEDFDTKADDEAREGLKSLLRKVGIDDKRATCVVRLGPCIKRF